MRETLITGLGIRKSFRESADSFYCQKKAVAGTGFFPFSKWIILVILGFLTMSFCFYFLTTVKAARTIVTTELSTNYSDAFWIPAGESLSVKLYHTGVSRSPEKLTINVQIPAIDINDTVQVELTIIGDSWGYWPTISTGEHYRAVNTLDVPVLCNITLEISQGSEGEYTIRILMNSVSSLQQAFIGVAGIFLIIFQCVFLTGHKQEYRQGKRRRDRDAIICYIIMLCFTIYSIIELFFYISRS